MSAEIQYIKSLDEFDKIINGDRPVVVDFTASWCGPCHMIAPRFAALAAEKPSVGFYKVDIDEQADIAQKYAIRSMPTFLSFYKGEKLEHSLSGANPPALEELVGLVAAKASA